jgi:hypothetical protein
MGRPARVLLTTSAIATAIVALALVGAGAALVGIHVFGRDADGFYSTGAAALHTPTYALASNGLDVDTDVPGWAIGRGRLGVIRITAASTSGRRVFLGIGRTSDVRSYLSRVQHDEMVDLQVSPLSVTTVRRRGAGTPARPDGERFWMAKASGGGRQELRWTVAKGDWSVVLMNADGSKGVGADVAIGARSSVVLWAGVAVAALGAVAGVIAACLAVLAVRASRANRSLDER